MVFRGEASGMVERLNQLISKGNPKQGLQIFQITNIDFQTPIGLGGYITDFKVSIKHLNFTLEYNNVPMMGIGLGHLKGIIKYPDIGDFVIVGFIGDQEPIVLGTIFDFLSQSPDSIPQVRLGDLLIVNQSQGAIILMNKENEVIISSSSVNKPKIKITKEDTIEIKKDDNSSVILKANGDVEIKGNNIQLASGSSGFARVGDSVSVTVVGGGSYGGETAAGTITSGSSKVAGGD